MEHGSGVPRQLGRPKAQRSISLKIYSLQPRLILADTRWPQSFRAVVLQWDLQVFMKYWADIKLRHYGKAQLARTAETLDQKEGSGIVTL